MVFGVGAEGRWVLEGVRCISDPGKVERVC